MRYQIHALKTGECTIRGRYVFRDREPDRLFTFHLFIYVLQGGARPMVVDTGPQDMFDLNRQVRFLLVDEVKQEPYEETPVLLRRAGVAADEVSHVFLTHMHYDHCSNLHLFPNAQIVISDHGLKQALDPGRGPTYLHAGFPEELTRLRPRLLLVDDAQVAPGVSVTRFGGHSPCSQGIVVDTEAGRVCIAGDVAFTYENIERDIPIGVYSDLEECRVALGRLREEFDVVLPGHDPAVLDRFPGGVVG